VRPLAGKCSVFKGRMPHFRATFVFVR